MQYLIQGRLARMQEVLQLDHEKFVELVRSRVIPTLQTLAHSPPERRILAGGSPAGTRGIVLMVDLTGQESHRCVREFLMSLPIFEYYEWSVTPIESLEELAKSYGIS